MFFKGLVNARYMELSSSILHKEVKDNDKANVNSKHN